jgi:hypothetical protein
MKNIILLISILLCAAILCYIESPAITKQAVRTWEEFAKDCRVECKKMHKGGSFTKKGKTYKCDIATIDELGNGGSGFGISFKDLCPKEYKKWDDQSTRKH